METKCKHMARHLLQDALVLRVLGSLLYCGVFRQFFDVAFYQCYTVAFWEGWLGLQKLPAQQCAFLARPDKGIYIHLTAWDTACYAAVGVALWTGRICRCSIACLPYHGLPSEYPLLALLPFFLGLLAPPHWYREAFALWMVLLAGLIYFVLQSWRSRRAALAYSLYLVVGGWMTRQDDSILFLRH